MLRELDIFTPRRSLIESGSCGVAGVASCVESWEVKALVVDVLLTWPKLTPRLWTSDGRMVAMAGGLLGQAELVRECLDMDDRRIEPLLRPERVKLELE